MRKQFTNQFYKKNKLFFTLATISVIITGAINLLLSWLLQQIIDAMSGTPGSFTFSTLSIFAAILILGVVLICVIDYYSKPRFYKRAMQQFKDFAFEKLTKKSISSFKDESTATYISGLTNDTNTIESKYLEKIFSLIQNLVFFFGALFMMIMYSPILTLIAIGLSLLPMIASILTGNSLAEAEKEVSRKNESFTATLKDCLNGFSVVKSFKAEKAILKLFQSYNEQTEDTKCKRRKIATIVSSLGAITGIIAQLGVFIAGAYLSITHANITPGVVMAFVNLMMLVIQPIAEIPTILADRKASLALIDKLSDALTSNIREEGSPIENNLHMGIELKNLSFSYDEDSNALQDINTRFEHGKSYAIVGGSGSGKSTLLNLLMASHNNYQGEITYDNVELSNISSNSLYDLISIVQQNVFVFNASIRDNIMMFRDFPKEEVDHAITQSGLTELIQKHGEDYLCGENGCNLSGGERQRISIARSLLRKTPVLLVDEATAALDKETAKHVSNSILDLESYTRIVVTHALEETLLKRYDQILAFKNGKLMEVGDFETLINEKGYFYSLYTVSQ